MSRSTYLAPLAGVRFLAAMHILLFHVAEGERVPALTGQTPPFRLFAELPSWLAQIIARGYCSTGFFFLLSGVVLAYLYLDDQGSLTITCRRFWISRFARLYPFHVVVLCLLAVVFLPVVFYLSWNDPIALQSFPTPTGSGPTWWGTPISMPLYASIGFVLNLFLLQSWFPEYALTGNFATWALSTVAFFYAVFPWVGPLLARQSRAKQWSLLVVLPLVSLIPSLVFMRWAEPAESLTIGSEFIFRFPPFWLAHFSLGILVARLAGVSRHSPTAEETLESQQRFASIMPSWGDAALVVSLIVLAIDDATWSRWLGLGAWRPNYLFRHGGLAPLIVIIAFDLVRGRGWFSRIMSLRWLQTLGAATYSVFILQLLFMAAAAGIAMLPWPALLRLSVIFATTALLAWLADRYCDQPLVRRVKRWLGLAPPPTGCNRTSERRLG